MITTIEKNTDLIETKKLQLISIIAQVYNFDLLEAIENLLLNSKSDWWTSITNLEQKAIEEGLDDIKSGRILSHQQVIHEINKIYKDL